MVAGTTQSIVMHVLQMAVVERTAAQPDTEAMEAVLVIWAIAEVVKLRRC